jgi:hypothetical protein
MSCRSSSRSSTPPQWDSVGFRLLLCGDNHDILLTRAAVVDSGLGQPVSQLDADDIQSFFKVP